LNGIGIEEALADWFDAQRILGCLAYVSAHRFRPAVITPQTPGRLVVGHLTGRHDLADEAVEMLTAAGIEARTTRSLTRARWKKLVWNAAFNPLSVSAGGVTTRQILGDPELRERVAGLMHEVIRIAQAEGCEIDADRLVSRMLEKTTPGGDILTSMLVDYQAGRPLELEWLLAEPVRRAARLGVDTPLLRSQLQLCRDLDRANRRPQHPSA
jgi:2-dehydropantoate 2-reductase